MSLTTHAHRSGTRVPALGFAALALVVTPLAPTAAQASGTSASSAHAAGSTTVQAAKPTPKPKAAKRVTLKTSYGKKAVATVTGKKYTLTFKGKKGDKVRIAAVLPAKQGGGLQAIEKRTLLGPKGNVIVAGADKYATLKRSGTHKIRFTATSSRTQLLKLVTRSTSNAKVTVPARTGHQYAVDVKVGNGARIATTGETESVRVAGKLSAVSPGWGDPSVLTAVPGQPLLDVSGYAGWAGTVGSAVRLYLKPQSRATVAPARLGVARVAVSGGTITVPASQGGTLVTLDASKVDHPYVTVVGLETSGFQARGPRGAELSRGGHAHRVVGTHGASSVALVLPPSGIARTFGVVPTPVHSGKIAVGGDSVTVPARADGLETLALVDPRGVLYADLTVHAAPAVAWSVTYGRPVSVTPPRGCNGCGEETATASQLGKHVTSIFGGLVGGSGAAVLISTGNVGTAGHFELSLTPRGQ